MRRASAFRALMVIALGATLSACASLPNGFDPLPAAEAPRFDALAFFTGRSEGRGRLSKVMSGSVDMRVSSEGTMRSDGTLVLVQEVREGKKAPRTRTWEIRETQRGRYTGTLTDAVGPIEGSSEGNVLTLRYRMKDRLDVEQRLTLSPNAQRAYNVLKVSRLGVTLAVLAEDIRRLE